MNKAAKMVATYFESKGIKSVRMDGDDEEVIRVSFSADNMEAVHVTMIFGEDNQDVGIRVFDFTKFPEGKREAIQAKLCELNEHFRWVKFYIDKNEPAVTAAIDAVIQLDSAGAICYELLYRTIGIVDQAYPELMKVIWA